MDPVATGLAVRLLEVEFAEPPRWRSVAPWALVASLAVVAAGAAAWAAVVGVELHRLRDAHAALAARVARAEAGAASAAALPKVAPPYQADAAAAARSAAFDVGAVMNALESAQVPSVRVVAFELSPPDGRARVEIESPGLEATLQYLDALNAGIPGRPWALVSAQASPTGQSATLQSAWDVSRPMR